MNVVVVVDDVVVDEDVADLDKTTARAATATIERRMLRFIVSFLLNVDGWEGSEWVYRN